MSLPSQVEILTIGHSNHTLEELIELLRKYRVSAVADVRSAPYSRYCPQFNKDSLALSLRERRINYVYLGRELGGRPSDLACYDNDGKVAFREVAKTPQFRKGIERLRKGAGKHRIAIMCSEREPLECHRTFLVAQTLVKEHIKVEHILGDGNLESHSETIERLLDLMGLPHEDLMHTKSELLTKAREQQERRIAFQIQDISEAGLREVG